MRSQGLWLGAGLALLVVAAGAGIWWQKSREAAQARAKILSVVEVELARDPLDRGGLMQADRDLQGMLDLDEGGALRRARARIALALRLPDEALRSLDEIAYVQQGVPEDSWLRAQALALRHAVGARIDDAHRAATLALDYHDLTRSIPAALLAWQCATRIDDDGLIEGAVERLTAAAPEAWETRVVRALRGFDPEKSEDVARVRSLQQEGPLLLELDAAVAAADVLSEDEDVRSRGSAAIQRVLERVPASKPARLVAVLACDRTGDAVGRAAHLQWLVSNFPNDPRAEAWRRMLSSG